MAISPINNVNNIRNLSFGENKAGRVGFSLPIHIYYLKASVWKFVQE